tara:strand:- start:395 stop:559 length:165 start_codon:yes stop_codon:yes gene_type:complete
MSEEEMKEKEKPRSAAWYAHLNLDPSTTSTHNRGETKESLALALDSHVRDRERG